MSPRTSGPRAEEIKKQYEQALHAARTSMSSATLMLSRPTAVDMDYHRPTRIAEQEITLRQPPARNRARRVECVPPLIEITTMRQAQQRATMENQSSQVAGFLCYRRPVC